MIDIVRPLALPSTGDLKHCMDHPCMLKTFMVEFPELNLQGTSYNTSPRNANINNFHLLKFPGENTEAMYVG